VELDGAAWRTLPAEVVLKAGLDVGVVVDRPRARRIGVEIRRATALSTALAALRHREHSRQALADRLGRAGVTAAASTEALETLERAGLVDDGRAALARAAALAARGAGDLMIRDDLARRGFPAKLVARTIGNLESEQERAERFVARRGVAARTFRGLAARGFSPEVVEAVVAGTGAQELG